MSKFEKEIWAYALKNAEEFGQAHEGKVLTKLFQHGLEKSEIGKVMPEVIKIVKEVNSKSHSWREKELEKYQEYLIVRAEVEKDLAVLPGISDKMVFRLAPFPSGALHLGNAKTYLLNALYAEKYNAKTLLVMDDTIGSEEKPIVKESYELIESGLQWLNIKYNDVIYKSDRLSLYYKYAEELIEKDKAYVCSCSQAGFKKLKDSEKECVHRKQTKELNKQLWKDMFKAEEGKMVLRIKTGMNHKNPAFRDRVLFKISDREHARIGKKHRVWPTLEMSWAVDDHELGVTHIIRGNDLMMETEMEKFIWNIFGWKNPEVIHTGLIHIELEGVKLSKSKAQKEVKSGEFSGWDDPRTWSIQSLKRRGIRAEAIREFVEEIGLNRQDITIPIEALYAVNRKLVDEESDRYFFVEKPVEIKLLNKPEYDEVEIPIHPDKKEKRSMKVGEIFISEHDFKAHKNKEVRLLHLYNIKLGGNGKKIIYTSIDNKKTISKIQWVSEYVKAKILMPNGAWKEGYADIGIKKLKEDDFIQFERFGFCRFDGKNTEKKGKKKEEVYEFWFAHK
ncbi:MAG: glutamate--tRNA ligase [Nanoarchaeota archaeon]